MKALFKKTSLFTLLATLLMAGLPVISETASNRNYVSADAQTRRSSTRRSTTRRSTSTDTALISLGAELRASLNNRLSSKDSRVGDRFTATVLAPESYEGARIHGHISSIRESGRVEGRTSMDLAFDSIELADGTTGTMHGELIRLYDPESDSKDIDEEGSVESDSRGKQTLKRGGIGAAAGAVLGGILGGGKGAVVGLIVGGAAGAGSVAIEGSKELELEPGVEMLVRVTPR